MACAAPFLPESAYPSTGGFVAGRFCGSVGANTSCCLPCPIEQWVYSDRFDRNAHIAHWFNVPAMVCQVFLLLTFALQPVEKCHRHYMSVGLCVSLILLELSFIIPLGTKPDQCHDAITPNDMYTSLSCAWSGSLLEAGAMAGVMWIFLRSLWTHLRVCWDFDYRPAFFWISQWLAWGSSALFLAVSLPITGVSYRFGTTCVPNQKYAFATWFGWLLGFACLAAAVQFVTTGFCLWLFLLDIIGGGSSGGSSNTAGGTKESSRALGGISQVKPQRSPNSELGNRLAWRRVKNVLVLQWRSILMSILVAIESVFFGIVFVRETEAMREDQNPARLEQIEQWGICLIVNAGDKTKCLGLAAVLGINEGTVIASLMLSALIGLFTFALMVRWSMFVGWYELLCHYRESSSQKGNEFIIMRPRRRTIGSMLALRATNTDADGRQSADTTFPFVMTGVLPEPGGSIRTASVPQPGEVTKRHETINLFDQGGQEENDTPSENDGDVLERRTSYVAW